MGGRREEARKPTEGSLAVDARLAFLHHHWRCNFFQSTSSVRVRFLGLEDAKVRYFCIYILCWRCFKHFALYKSCEFCLELWTWLVHSLEYLQPDSTNPASYLSADAPGTPADTNRAVPISAPPHPRISYFVLYIHTKPCNVNRNYVDHKRTYKCTFGSSKDHSRIIKR